MKNIKFILLYIATPLLILCIIFLPIFSVSSSSFSNTIVIGYNILGRIKINGEIILKGKFLSYIPLIMLIFIILIGKFSNGIKGNNIIFILSSLMCVVYFSILPLVSKTFVASTFESEIQFTMIWGYYVLLAFSILLTIGFIVSMIIEKINNKNIKIEE